MNNENFSVETEMLLDHIGRLIMEDERRPGIINPVRLWQLQFSHALLAGLSVNADVRIECKAHEPFPSVGSISIEGDMIEFEDCPQLAAAIRLADNLDIYPLTTGKIRMVLTFHGLVKRV